MWPDLQETADLVTFTEEIPSAKRHFCRVSFKKNLIISTDRKYGEHTQCNIYGRRHGGSREVFSIEVFRTMSNI